MEGTVFDAVDVGAVPAQFAVHPAVQIVHVAFAVVAVRDTALVGHDEDQVAGVVQPAHGFTRALDPADLVGTVNVARILVQHAVAIEEGGGSPS